MKPTELTAEDIETIFFGSRIYGGYYAGEHLVAQRWDWPRSTWMQRRLQEIRKEQTDER